MINREYVLKNLKWYFDNLPKEDYDYIINKYGITFTEINACITAAGYSIPDITEPKIPKCNACSKDSIGVHTITNRIIKPEPTMIEEHYCYDCLKKIYPTLAGDIIVEKKKCNN